MENAKRGAFPGENQRFYSALQSYDDRLRQIRRVLKGTGHLKKKGNSGVTICKLTSRVLQSSTKFSTPI